MDRELMQQALEALESDNPDIQLRAAIALRQALETEREWAGLTDEEINSVRHKRDWTAPWTDTTFARAIEAKLREKNHG